MKRTIKLNNGEEIKLECNAASPIIFKRHWNEDLMNGFQTLTSGRTDNDKLITFMEKVLYTFNKNAELGTKGALDHEVTADSIEFIEFLSKFDFLEIVTGEVLDTVTEMWGVNIKTEAEPKNL